MREFFRGKQYKIGAICVAAAILGAVGVYSFAEMNDKEPEQQQTAQGGTEEENIVKTAENETETEEKETKTASSVIKPKKKNEKSEVKISLEKDTQMPEIAKADEAAGEEIPGTEETAQAEEKAEAQEIAQAAETAESEETVETAAKPSNAIELHFDTAAGLDWPVTGAVILNYSMDKTVYFTTLDQYKYNPAVIIAGNVNEKVKAAASGKIIDISTNEVTGCTVTMDLGDGYTAVYGQLKEVPYNVGAYVEAGNTIGFINEPTKYYSLEGSNLYFQLEKDNAPIDPVEYFGAE